MDNRSNKVLTLPATTAELDAFIDAGTALSGVKVDPAYREGVRTHLAAITNAASLVLAFEVEDDAEPAPVFHP